MHRVRGQGRRRRVAQLTRQLRHSVFRELGLVAQVMEQHAVGDLGRRHQLPHAGARSPVASRCPDSRSVTTCRCAARTVMGRLVAEAGSRRQSDGVQGAVVNSEHPVGSLQEGGSVGFLVGAAAGVAFGYATYQFPAYGF